MGPLSMLDTVAKVVALYCKETMVGRIPQNYAKIEKIEECVWVLLEIDDDTVAKREFYITSFKSGYIRLEMNYRTKHDDVEAIPLAEFCATNLAVETIARAIVDIIRQYDDTK